MLGSGALVSAQQSDAASSAIAGARLVPGAPHWAKWASSTVYARFTPQWQAVAKTAASFAAASIVPSLEIEPEAAVSFGQVMFNRDPTILAQNATTVVFDPLSTTRVAGGYNDYRGLILTSTAVGGDFSGWSISSSSGASVLKDGQLQPVFILGEKVPSGGDPVLAVDRAGNYFYGSVYFDPISFTPNNGVVIARSPKFGSATGIFSAACPGGDGNINCWPTVKLVAGEACTTSGGHFNDKDYIAVDDSTSVAAGSVYVVWSKLGCANSDSSSAIVVAKCTNTLSSCTAPVTLESTPGTGAVIDELQLSHIAISPVNGKVYLTWDKFFGTLGSTATDTIRMRVISPSASAASVGTLGPLRTVVSETQPIPLELANPYPGQFRISTYPHVGIKGGRAIVVWDRRTTKSLLIETFFFDSDILARFTDNDGASFSATQTVSSAANFQYQPAICLDPVSGRVVVPYYSAQNDSVAKHRQDIYVSISPTGAAPYTPLRVTPVSNVTENNPVLGDSFIGDYLEAACGPNFALVHYTANYTAKSDAPFDPVPAIIPQQDTFMAKVTLP
jgi:hypothetical protein